MMKQRVHILRRKNYIYLSFIHSTKKDFIIIEDIHSLGGVRKMGTNDIRTPTWGIEFKILDLYLKVILTLPVLISLLERI